MCLNMTCLNMSWHDLSNCFWSCSIPSRGQMLHSAADYLLNMKQPTSWQPVSRIKWRRDIIIGRAIMTLYLCTKMVTISSKGPPNLSNFLFERQWSLFCRWRWMQAVLHRGSIQLQTSDVGLGMVWRRFNIEGRRVFERRYAYVAHVSGPNTDVDFADKALGRTVGFLSLWKFSRAAQFQFRNTELPTYHGKK